VDSAKFHQQQKYRGMKPTNYVSGDLSFVPYNPLFANDAQTGQPVLASYGQESFDRLKSIHEQYDPNDLFLLQTGGLKFWT
jgi:hypothetical protein